MNELLRKLSLGDADWATVPVRQTLPVKTVGLRATGGFADTLTMLDFEHEELATDADWRPVLTAYLAEHAARSVDEEFDGWIPRIAQVEGVDRERLPKIHGRLIACGYLKFQLAGRTLGVVYQVSAAGKSALKVDESNTTDSIDETPDDSPLAAAG